ncbi:spore protease YyaC [Paenibacillus urinalis]|uniref:Spore protease YyaC n=1 Tax=Paenibacillus urinalis TaxID=521520 RepID=A0AAX3MZZ1_9BACL|nr:MULTISPECIES: spore protease YyaC [Paenibacillus]WDH82696.1 spore protease YyaC [Paenibacillus urinalis]WDH98746.1 spore protease YyaC [Paenibacillus urinalis]WDI02440.1 spore protease YyaC [Paenibacillus urinalis]GAK41470.1 putative sporulation protein [Paenibacillus sp. TCA20]
MNRIPKAINLQDMPGLKLQHTDPGVQSAIIHRLLFHLFEAPHHKEIVIVCIGTDRSTGDCLGPLVGTALSEHNSPFFHLYGTLEDPVHAMNLQDTLTMIYSKHRDPYIIGIDACLGQASSVGCIQVASGPLKPGAGVNKELPPVGDIHLTGIVNVGGFMEYFVLQNTRLSLVVRMSNIIAHSLYAALVEWHNRSTLLAVQE